MDNLDRLPPGMAQRLQQIEDGDEDEVDYRVPPSWSVPHTTFDPSLATSGSLNASSSVSNPFSPSSSSQFAPALAQRQKRKQPNSNHYSGRFTFSTAIPDAPEQPDWTTKEFNSSEMQSSEKEQQSVLTGSSPNPSYSEGSTIGESRRIGALEATFGSESVSRFSESDENNNPRRSVSATRSLDPRFDDPELNIPENILANFLPINRLHEAYPRQSREGSITTQLGGQTIVYHPKTRDTRLDHLDRHQNYIGKDLGAISKRFKRQHKEDVAERDRQMLQATAEWRAWSAMSPDERVALCDQLKKPAFFCGADKADQFDEEEIPEVYTRKVSIERIINWMSENTPLGDIERGSIRESPSKGGQNSTSRKLVDSFQPAEQSTEIDEFAMGEDFISLKSPVKPRTSYEVQGLIKTALDFKNSNYAGSIRSESSHFRPASIQGQKQASSVSGASSAVSSAFGTASSYDPSLCNPFTIDIRPELQPPKDYSAPADGCPSRKETQLFNRASSISQKNGRIVVVRLHEPVKFTPGAIVQRVFGGIVQELQVFPVHRLAVLIFLHCTEARSFVRHVKSVSHYGNAQEIRQLQIDADWYK
jgi:hypothetical protein